MEDTLIMLGLIWWRNYFVLMRIKE